MPDEKGKLTGAYLRRSFNLNLVQLDKACGDAKTKLPAELTIRPCESVKM